MALGEPLDASIAALQRDRAGSGAGVGSTAARPEAERARSSEFLAVSAVELVELGVADQAGEAVELPIIGDFGRR